MWSTGRKDHFASFTKQNKQSLPLLSLFTLLVHSLTLQYHTATYTTTIKYDLVITTNTASTTGTITLFYTVHVLLVQLTKKKNAYYATAFFYGLAIKLLRLPSCIRSTMYCLNPDCGVPFFNTSRLVLTMPVVLSTIELIALWDSMSVLHFQQMQCSCMTDFFKCLQKSN